jgi:hypothetical protein
MTIEEFFQALPQVAGGKPWRSMRGVPRSRLIRRMREMPHGGGSYALCDCPISALHAALCTDHAHRDYATHKYFKAGACIGLAPMDARAIADAADGDTDSPALHRYRRRLLRILRPQREPKAEAEATS